MDNHYGIFPVMPMDRDGRIPEQQPAVLLAKHAKMEGVPRTSFFLFFHNLNFILYTKEVLPYLSQIVFYTSSYSFTTMSIQDQLAELKENILDFFTFIAGKLKNFRSLTLGEQISYCSVGAGLLLIIISVVLFIF